jgi:PAS domain S-box-containing protein
MSDLKDSKHRLEVLPKTPTGIRGLDEITNGGLPTCVKESQLTEAQTPERKIRELQHRLSEAEETLRAIRSGEVDGLVVGTYAGDQIFTVEGANGPYRFLIEEMNEGALMLLEDGTIVYANTRFAELSDEPLESVTGSFVHKFFTDVTKVSTTMKRAQSGSVGEELQLKVKNGPARTVQFSVFPLHPGGTEGFAAIVTDLTRQKVAERELRNSADELETRVRNRTAELTRANEILVTEMIERKRVESQLRQAETLLSKKALHLEKLVQERTTKLAEMVGELESFSYSMVHDLRAPLRAMDGFAKLLADEFGNEVGDRGRDYIRRIVGAAKRLDDLIQDALNYTKIASGHLRTDIVDADALVREVIDSYPNLRPHRDNIAIESTLPKVIANPSLLTQCIANLLDNGVKFVLPGKVPRLKIWAEPRLGCVRLNFQDNGIGIQPSARDRIFQMFERLHGPQQYEGTGIGLAIVRKGVERMGGKTGVDSTPGAGSCFWIELTAAGQGL